jgi:hypothetical protein
MWTVMIGGLPVHLVELPGKVDYLTGRLSGMWTASRAGGMPDLVDCSDRGAARTSRL